jgi:heat shock protein HslJ
MAAEAFDLSVSPRLSGTALLSLAALACAPMPAPAPQVVNVPYPVSSNMIQLPVEGTEWRVLSLSGHETPGDGDYRLKFANGRVSARFGCNEMGGTYRISGAIITVSPLEQTLIGCAEPARSFEELGKAILQAPMNIGMEPTTGGPVLFIGAGRIDLVPIVTGRRL